MCLADSESLGVIVSERGSSTGLSQCSIRVPFAERIGQRAGGSCQVAERVVGVGGGVQDGESWGIMGKMTIRQRQVVFRGLYLVPCPFHADKPAL